MCRTLFFAPFLLLAAPLAAQDLLVSSRFSDEVLRYDGATGAPLGAFASGGGLDNPIGITFGPDGDLYVVSGDTNQVLRYDGTSGAFIDVFVDSAELNGPRNLNFGPNGNLFVANGGTSQVLEFDAATGTALGAFAEGGGLSAPTSFTFGPDGHIYVPGVLSGNVIEYDETGALVGVFVSAGVNLPHDVGFGPDGHFYITNAGNSRINKRDGQTGDGLGEFLNDPALLNPLGMTWGLDGMLYVANQGRNDVRRYDATTGAAVDTFVSSGSGGLDAPLFLAFMPETGGVQVASVSGAGADAENTVNITGARAGARLVLAYGRTLGSTPVVGCPGLFADLRPAKGLAKVVSDESGNSVVRRFVPAHLAGLTIQLQVLNFSDCTKSPLFPHVF